MRKYEVGEPTCPPSHLMPTFSSRLATKQWVPKPLVGNALLSEKVSACQGRLDKVSITDMSLAEPRGHPTPGPNRAAHGQSKPSIAHDDNGCSDAEQHLDNGWQSGADVSDAEVSCNEDADADVPESDDPELAGGGPVLLSAKLAAEVRNFRIVLVMDLTLFSSVRFGSRRCNSTMQCPSPRPSDHRLRRSPPLVMR